MCRIHTTYQQKPPTQKNQKKPPMLQATKKRKSDSPIAKKTTKRPRKAMALAERQAIIYPPLQTSFDSVNYTTPGRGKVYVAAMTRGIGRPDVAEAKNPHRLNVTSAQAAGSEDRLTFSPLTHRMYTVNNGTWHNFESWWQSGKRYADTSLSPDKVCAFWTRNTKPMRRMPGTAGKKVLYCEWPSSHDGKLDYVTSRKVAYVPMYETLIQHSVRLAYWRRLLDAGNDVVVYDFDGPRHPETRADAVLEVTETMLRTKIADVSTPFGHGYVVGALLMGISHSRYT